MKSRRSLYCTNCKQGMPKQYVFQGVVICEKCHTIVTRCVEKAQTELRMLFLTYTDMLRQALVKGEMNFPVLPKGARMPQGEMEAALQKAASRIGGLDAKGLATEGDGKVPMVRGNEDDPNGEVQRRGHPKSVSRGRHVRSMFAVQEDGPTRRRGPTASADPPEGMAQDTGGVDGSS
jgi:hypothetical protein